THRPRIPQRGELPDAYPADQRRENRSVNTLHSRVIHHEPRRARIPETPFGFVFQNIAYRQQILGGDDFDESRHLGAFRCGCAYPSE
ncbi:hypothetical protein, partial [Brachybacterium fresconis]|uniref:hypothetical protein n=1 Tax=Brachybacterium fresconis TaxID=173363 RepID=UPI0036103BFD